MTDEEEDRVELQNAGLSFLHAVDNYTAEYYEDPTIFLSAEVGLKALCKKGFHFWELDSCCRLDHASCAVCGEPSGKSNYEELKRLYPTTKVGDSDHFYPKWKGYEPFPLNEFKNE